MLPILAGIPTILIAVILQTAVISRVQLLNGAADLVLLTVVSWVMNDRVSRAWSWAILAGLAVGFVSELPFWLVLGAYLLTTAIGLALRRRVWQIPVLALLAAVIISTLILHVLSFGFLQLQGVPLDPIDTFNLITLPTLLLNLIFAIPVQAVVNEIVNLTHPESLDE